MKKGKLIIAFVISILLSLLVVTPATADPKKEGTLDKSPVKNIVRDPLATTGVDPDAKGWVTFACQSLEGFQYSITVKGLVPNSTYTVEATALFATFVPELGFVVPTSDGGATYALGTIKTNGAGEGEINEGLVPLPAFNAALGIPLGIYEWAIEVKDTSEVAVLGPAPDPIFPPFDYQGFVVFTEWP